MQHNIETPPAEFLNEFTSSHFTRLARIHAKAQAFVERDDVTLTQLDRALIIELRMEKYVYELSLREERAQKALQPRQTKPKSSSTPSPEARQPDPAPELPSSAENAPKPVQAPQPASPPSKPALTVEEARCSIKRFGHPSKNCSGCINGYCRFLTQAVKAP